MNAQPQRPSRRPMLNLEPLEIRRLLAAAAMNVPLPIEGGWVSDERPGQTHEHAAHEEAEHAADDGEDHDDGLSIVYLPQTHSARTEVGQFLTGRQKGRRADLARGFFVDSAADFGLKPADVAGAIITSQYTDAPTGVTHVYLQQSLNGLPIQNAVADIHFMSDGRVITAHSSFIPGIGQVAQRTAAPDITRMIHPLNALRSAAAALEVDYPAASPEVDFQGGASLKFDVTSAGLSQDQIPMSAEYVPTEEGVRLAWSAVMRPSTGDGGWYDLAIDAQSGQVIFASNWVSHLVAYNVFPQPVEAPHDGTRSVVTDPWDLTASPFGWHDTDGDIDVDFTDTRGNNVEAQEDADNNNTPGARPSGGAAAPLNFNFAFNAANTPNLNLDAATTNLFYWNNVNHDLHYHYGFTEAAGNFQTNNYGRGGSGNDAVQADSQDGSGTNNANFGTPPDGQAPRMQMYIWTAATPDRDSSFDAGVISHEYGHGVSNRLTGGPANASALDATQSGGMGEGWSDFFGIMFTQKPGDTANAPTGVATYLNNQATTGTGIRLYPYSFDMTVNPITIDYYGLSGTSNGVPRSTAVHRTGTTWASALWDMNWLLINKYGYDSNLYTGYNGAGTTAERAGNKLALQLVLDGLKLQPANPSFADARDAILRADQVLTGGANQAELWQAFARRGMGFSFDSGLSASFSTVTPAFDVPPVDPLVQDIKTRKSFFAPPSSIAMKFSEPMNTSSFSVANDVISFTGPGATDLLPQVTGFSWSGDGQTLTLNFNPQAALGSYTLVIGPSIVAADNGNSMDQDRDGTPGETTADRYSVTFTHADRIGPVAGDASAYIAGQTFFENLNLVPGGPGVTSIAGDADDQTVAIPMGTNSFRLYSTNYSSGANAVNASTNGFISFGASSTVAQNTDLNSPNAARIAGLWDDWITNAGPDDQLLYRLDDLDGNGSQDRLVVEWNQIPHFASTLDPVTFQIILQLNTGTTPGTMIVNYVDIQTGDPAFSNGASSTVGIKEIGTPPPTRLLVTAEDPAFPWLGDGKAIRIATDWTAPTATSAFNFNTASQNLRYVFSENVGASLTKADLTLVNTSTAQTIPQANLALAYVPATNTATVTFPGLPNGASLPDGNYTATLSRPGVTDPSWMPLDAASSTFSFFVFAGDADRDRDVDIDDFGTLAARFNQAGTFTQGDFNYSGTADIDDFAILASKFNSSLAPAAAARAATSAGTPVAGTLARPVARAPFGNERIGDELDPIRTDIL